jgi:dienelactone hydrolase
MQFRTQVASVASFVLFLFGSSIAAPATAAQASPATPAADRVPTPAEPAGSGPYKAVMEADPTLAMHTIYSPADMNAIGNGTLPIVVWGEGGCFNAGNMYSKFLTDIASYGYLILATGSIVPGIETKFAPAPPSGERPAAAAPAAPAPPPQLPQGQAVPTHPSQLVDALNWAIAESKRPDSKYYGKLATDRVAVMGQSCGGVQAIEVAADPRISTAMIWDSGLFPQPTGMGGGKTMSKDDLKLLHAPVAYITGDAQDIAFPNANDDFEKIQNVPVFRGWERGVPHMGTYSQPNGGEFSGVAIAWLNWQLKGDAHAALMFKGENCGLCVNPRWVVSKKKID